MDFGVPKNPQGSEGGTLGFENLLGPPAVRTECLERIRIGQFKIIELLRRLILSPFYCNADVTFQLVRSLDPLTVLRSCLLDE